MSLVVQRNGLLKIALLRKPYHRVRIHCPFCCHGRLEPYDMRTCKSCGAKPVLKIFGLPKSVLTDHPEAYPQDGPWLEAAKALLIEVQSKTPRERLGSSVLHYPLPGGASRGVPPPKPESSVEIPYHTIH